jgi:hypothetical protein
MQRRRNIRFPQIPVDAPPAVPDPHIRSPFWRPADFYPP